MTKTTLKHNPNLQPPKDSVSPRQIILPQGLPPTSHRKVLKTRAAPPAILSSGSVDWETAKELFDRFFKHVSVSSVYPSSFQEMNIYSVFYYLPAFVSVLDPVLHTVQNVYERDPFLLTVSKSSPPI
ncbi:hypothetical protein BU17DRAFT_98228 [Hysterangium stoloniferum]|nr:hypothetical protein BU17DRAFT_98228 [Hysterangium stoloniferum]